MLQPWDHLSLTLYKQDFANWAASQIRRLTTAESDLQADLNKLKRTPSIPKNPMAKAAHFVISHGLKVGDDCAE